ncbi:hypothetical protein PHYBOEH_001127 [Phytophthora boehmeriae]|uniref:Multidrug/Oligosaccharidyl-lipid/Polysaccharide (MOP) Flippase Superfamily n=1 Tax=Phytophthora boehmeriae TaxID=109152 RepID=A0A8T1WY69_9STRA|nr:hypothetical protein PHYBOEH_001127 [Phytophthora boehmeriae]
MDEHLIDKRLSALSESFVTIDGLQVGPNQKDEPEPRLMEETRELLKLVFPVVGTTVLEFLPGFVSVLLAGNMDSPNAQHYVDAAAISVMLLNVSALSLGLGLASALDTLCSQAYGAKRFEKIGIYFQTGVLVLGVALVPMLLVNAFAEPILNVLGQDRDVTYLTRDFSRLMLPGLPFLFLYELVRKVLSAQNILKPLVIIAVIANLVNLAAGYGLAYHTSVGFNGIAIARTLGNITLALLLVPYFWWSPGRLTQWWCHGWDLKAAAGYVRLFLRIGFPGMLMMSVESWAFEVLAILAGNLPDSVTALATHAVLMNIIVMVWTVLLGFGVASSIRVGNLLGSNSPKKAKLACHASIAMTFGTSLVFAALLVVLNRPIPRLFLSDEESIDLAAKILILWFPFEIADGLNTSMQGIFRGAGKQKSAAISNLVGYYGFGIPLGVLLAFHYDFGVKGLWLGIGFGMVGTVLGLSFLMLRYWKWSQLAVEAQQRTAQ